MEAEATTSRLRSESPLLEKASQPHHTRSPSPWARSSSPAGVASQRINRCTIGWQHVETRLQGPVRSTAELRAEVAAGAGMNSVELSAVPLGKKVSHSASSWEVQDGKCAAGAQSRMAARARRSTGHVDFDRENPARSPSPFDVKVASLAKVASRSPDLPRKPRQQIELPNAALRFKSATLDLFKPAPASVSTAAPPVCQATGTQTEPTEASTMGSRASSKPKFELQFGALRDRYTAARNAEPGEKRIWRPSGGPESVRNQWSARNDALEERARTPRTPRSSAGTPRTPRSNSQPQISPRRNRSTSHLPGDVISAARSVSRRRSAVTVPPDPAQSTPRAAGVSSAAGVEFSPDVAKPLYAEVPVTVLSRSATPSKRHLHAGWPTREAEGPEFASRSLGSSMKAVGNTTYLPESAQAKHTLGDHRKAWRGASSTGPAAEANAAAASRSASTASQCGRAANPTGHVAPWRSTGALAPAAGSARVAGPMGPLSQPASGAEGVSRYATPQRDPSRASQLSPFGDGSQESFVLHDVGNSYTPRSAAVPKVPLYDTTVSRTTSAPSGLNSVNTAAYSPRSTAATPPWPAAQLSFGSTVLGSAAYSPRQVSPGQPLPGAEAVKAAMPTSQAVGFSVMSKENAFVSPPNFLARASPANGMYNVGGTALQPNGNPCSVLTSCATLQNSLHGRTPLAVPTALAVSPRMTPSSYQLGSAHFYV